MSTVRFLLGVVATEDLELIQLDVKTDFLHGNLKEEIYMEQLKGFVGACQEKRRDAECDAVIPHGHLLRSDLVRSGWQVSASTSGCTWTAGNGWES